MDQILFERLFLVSFAWFLITCLFNTGGRQYKQILLRKG